jgi:hypothetical protein
MAYKMKGSPYPKRKVTWGTDDAGNTVKTITRGKGSNTASRTVTYSQETGKKLSKHREAGFGGVSGHILGNPVGGEKTVDFSKGRGLGKTMVTKDVGVYNPDPKAKGLDFIEKKFFPSDTKTVTSTRGQMIKKGVGTTAKAAAGWGLSYPTFGAEVVKGVVQNPKEAIELGGALALGMVAAPPAIAAWGVYKVAKGVKNVGKKIGSKVKNVATNVRKKRLAKKTK